MTVLVTSLNTMMYAAISVTVFLKFVKIELWKKITTASLTAPEYIGFVLWLSKDSDTNRSIYLICQYFSYFSLIGVGIYHFVEMMFEYFVSHS